MISAIFQRNHRVIHLAGSKRSDKDVATRWNLLAPDLFHINAQ